MQKKNLDKINGENIDKLDDLCNTHSQIQINDGKVFLKLMTYFELLC